MKKSKNIYEIWKIEWKDHTSSYGGWSKPSDLDLAVLVITSVGYLINETKETITLALNFSNNEDGKVNTYITIIKSCITFRKKLS